MKRLLLLIIALLPMMSMAQRTIENPIIGARSMGTCVGFFIDKIELSNTSTKLYLTNYHGYKEGQMKISSGTTLRSGDKRWKVVSAEGINLDEPTLPKDNVEFVTHFVLNFPAIDPKLETVDYIESDDPNSFQLFDVALTDRAAAEIKKRNTVPDEVKNYAKNIKDNGESLDKNGFSMQDAIVKGKLYGFDKRFFGGTANPEITVYIFNPFTAEQDNYHATVATDGSYEIHVPMTSKYQVVYLSMTPIIHGQIMLSAGKTVVADFDFCQIYRPWELPANKLLPYFSGENVDINFALSNDLIDGFYRLYINGSVDVQKRYVNYSPEEFQDYILNAFDSFCSGVIDKSPFTKRAKELLIISAKSEAAYLLSQYPSLVQRAYRQINGKTGREPIPEFTMPEYDEQYLDYHKLLGLDDDMMFYANAFAYNISGWEMCFFHVYRKFRIYNNYYNFIADIWENLPTKVKMTKAEKKIAPVYAQKVRERDNALTDEEKAFRNKFADDFDHQEDIAIAEKEKIADMNFVRLLGEGDCYFKDFIKLQEYCKPLNRQTVVPDSIVAEIEKMRFPFYAEYVKARNARLLAQIEAEKQRGGYYLHTVSDSEGDSLLEEILKDYRGKVVFIDFWNTWCSPCRSAIQQMKPMKRTLDGKDVEFVYIASTSSPENEYAGMIPSMHGHHYRLSERQYESLLRKWNFTGIPSYLIIGKDGMVKDYHTGFQHAEYYKQKINEELNK
ncbi:MAG: redoxin family protein [Bacteroidales bacterium]|nr:redoxin family protein [Bacteroidales bacterium]